jgi:hypothetical protein
MKQLVLVALLGLSSLVAAEPKPKPKPSATLTVTKLEPAKGDADGGTYVRMIGTSFLTDSNGKPAAALAKVYFGSRRGDVVRIVSDTELIVQAPGGKAGEVVDVLVLFESRGELKLPQAFTYVTKP